MAYGNTVNAAQFVASKGKGHGANPALVDRALANPTIARVPDPGLVAERQRIKNMMSDLAHVTPTGELVTYAPEPFGDKIRMLTKDLSKDDNAAQAMAHNRQMASMLLQDDRLRRGGQG